MAETKDKPLDPANQLPTQAQKVIPHWLISGGVLLMGLPYLYAKMGDAGALGDLGGNADWAALAGAIASIGGVILNWGKDKMATSAVDSAKAATAVAEASPPVNIDGKTDPHLTLSFAVQQLLATNDPGDRVLAHKIIYAQLTPEERSAV